MPDYQYLRDPAEIYRRSAEIVARETDLDALPEALVPIAVRLVHACGMPEIVEGQRGGVRLIASHYPFEGDTTGVERHSSHRPADTAQGIEVMVDARHPEFDRLQVLIGELYGP